MRSRSLDSRNQPALGAADLVRSRVSTLLLSPRHTRDSAAVGAAALGLGRNVERLPSWRVPDHLRAVTKAAYGEPRFVAAVAEATGLELIEPRADWLPSLPIDLLQRRVVLSSLGEARARPGPLFAKPVSDKIFPATIYANGTDLPTPAGVEDSTPVLMSEVVEWLEEYRCFVIDREVVAISPYLCRGQLACTAEGEWRGEHVPAARAFSNAALARPEVATIPAFVLDVGALASEKWAIVEANPAWGSGILGCDPVEATRCVIRACSGEA